MSTIYLYVKQHSVTGLKYFGKTYHTNPFKYLGSGEYWTKHIKQHGTDQVKTIEVWGFDDQETCTNFAIKFSNENNIVNSTDNFGKKIWANLIIENGLDGGSKGQKQHPNSNQTGKKRSEESKQKMRLAKIGKKQTQEHIQKRVNKNKGKKWTDEQKSNYKKIRVYGPEERKKRRINGIGRKHSKETIEKMKKPKETTTCPHCHINGSIANMKRWHFDNCKIIRNSLHP